MAFISDLSRAYPAVRELNSNHSLFPSVIVNMSRVPIFATRSIVPCVLSCCGPRHVCTLPAPTLSLSSMTDQPSTVNLNLLSGHRTIACNCHVHIRTLVHLWHGLQGRRFCPALDKFLRIALTPLCQQKSRNDRVDAHPRALRLCQTFHQM